MVLVALGVRPVVAQDWHLGLQGGRIRSALDPTAEATTTLSAGLRFEAAHTAVRLSGGVPTVREEPLWGSLALWQRVTTRDERGLFAGVDLSGVGFLSHDRGTRSAPLPGGGGGVNPSPAPTQPVANRSGHALAGQMLPLIGFASPNLQVHTRAGVSHFTSRLGDGSLDRTVVLADLQVTALPWPSLALVPAVRHYSAEDEPGVTYAGLTMVLASARTRLSGTLGHWSGAPDVSTPWSVGARTVVGPRMALELAARHDALDPLYGQPPQTSWSAGVSIQIGGRRGIPRLPVPADYTDGLATLELPLEATDGPPSIAGDFTSWKPVRMEQHGAVWRHVVRLPPGVYHYAFVDGSGRWFVPKDVPGRREDGMGGHVAVVVIE